MILHIKNESGFELSYATPGSIGLDLRACIDCERWIHAGERWKFDTGISLELPPGYGALVQPRSGMSLHHGVIAATGVIDRDYRGRISVILYNHSKQAYRVAPGDRVAQLLIVPVEQVTLIEVDELSETERDARGFGSTGR